MGYNGMGYQRWIATLKPRKFLSKRSKPDGGGMEHLANRDIEDFFHLEKNNLENLLKKRYSKTYKQFQKEKFNKEQQTAALQSGVSIIIALVLVITLVFYIGGKMNLF